MKSLFFVAVTLLLEVRFFYCCTIKFVLDIRSNQSQTSNKF